MARVLIVEDDPRMREMLAQLVADGGHEARPVGTGREALDLASREPVELAILDLGLPDVSGLDILKDLRDKTANAPVIVLTGDGEMATTIRAMRDGAFDYVTKPVASDTIERMVVRALAASDLRTPVAEVPAVKPEPSPREEGPPDMVGHSSSMREVFKTLGLLAASRATVLIRGESGTGKELAAHALHAFSDAAREPFVTVNCAALPGPLIESELFGYRRGAFTGADRDRAGKLEVSGPGTLFLDEVGDVPLEAQVKLLRVLQERRYERLGETEPRQFRARVVAATHRDLEAMVREGRFREDLYFRLNVAVVTIPPLRERRSDITLLAQRLLGEIAREIGRPIEGLSEAALDRLVTYDWPGNVRELRNVLTRAAVRTRSTVLGAQDLELGSGSVEPTDPGSASVEAARREHARFPTLDEVEREHVVRALARARGHRGETCRLLGVSRPTLIRKLRKYKIDADAARPAQDGA